MKRLLISAAVFVIGTLAKAEDFPGFDLLHSHCQINSINAGKTCEETFGSMDRIVKAF